MRKHLLLLLIFLICVSSNLAEWIDPFNMNVNSLKEQENSMCHTPTALDSDLLHYKRLINLILSSVAIDRTDPSVYKGHLLINIPTENYDFLRQFTKEPQKDPLILQKVDYILARIFTKPTIDQLTDAMLSWSDHLYFTVFNRTTGVLISVLLTTFSCYKLLRANWSLSLVIKYLVFLAWLTDFAFTWNHLLQENEINKIADTLRYGDTPPQCDPSKMTFFQYFISIVSKEDECRRYHKTTLKDILWTVGPLTVLADQFGKIIVTPASHIGAAVSNLTREMLGGLFWPLNIILLPILLLFTLILTCIFLSFLTKTTFNVNLFHLLQFKFGSEERRLAGDVLSGEHLMKLIDGALHRPMLQEVKDTRSSKKYSKQNRGNKEAKALKAIPELSHEDKRDKKKIKKAKVNEQWKNKSEPDDQTTKMKPDISESLTVSFCEELSKSNFNESSSGSSNSLNISSNSVNSSDLDINKY